MKVGGEKVGHNELDLSGGEDAQAEGRPMHGVDEQVLLEVVERLGQIAERGLGGHLVRVPHGDDESAELLEAERVRDAELEQIVVDVDEYAILAAVGVQAQLAAGDEQGEQLVRLRIGLQARQQLGVVADARRRRVLTTGGGGGGGCGVELGEYVAHFEVGVEAGGQSGHSLVAHVLPELEARSRSILRLANGRRQLRDALRAVHQRRRHEIAALHFSTFLILCCYSCGLLLLLSLLQMQMNETNS